MLVSGSIRKDRGTWGLVPCGVPAWDGVDANLVCILVFIESDLVTSLVPSYIMTAST